MPIGSDQYATDELTEIQREALYRAAHQVAERYMDDLTLLARHEVGFDATSMADDLPRKHLRRYNVSFARRFLISA